MEEEVEEIPLPQGFDINECIWGQQKVLKN